MVKKIRFLIGMWALMYAIKIFPDSTFVDRIILSMDFDLLDKEINEMYKNK